MNRLVLLLALLLASCGAPPAYRLVLCKAATCAATGERLSPAPYESCSSKDEAALLDEVRARCAADRASKCADVACECALEEPRSVPDGFCD